MNRILVIAAHPDDEVLGCGATMARLAAEGSKINIVILGEGLTSRQEGRSPESLGPELDRLHRQAAAAGAMVGAESIEVLSLPDNRFDTVPLLDIVKLVEKKVSAVSPSVVFTHHAHDLNIDHQIAFKAVMTACRPGTGCSPEILSFEIPSSTEWQAPEQSLAFAPNTFFKLTEEHVQAKLRAMEQYTSEQRAFPHPRSAEALSALARWRGSCCASDYAEAFVLLRAIR